MSYFHLYEEKDKNQSSFILLHGTGGKETDLLKVAHWLNPSYNILAIRGDVDEDGALRFFKRKGHGQYDLDDLNKRGKALLSFIQDFAYKNALDTKKMIPLGFSNGANIAINMLLRLEADFERAILMAPMYPVDVKPGPDLSDLKVFVSMGKDDPITPLEESQRVIEIFENRKAQVHEHWTKGHQITNAVLEDAKSFLKN